MRPFARVAAAVAFLVAAIGGTSPSHAYVQQIIIDGTSTANYNPIPLGSSTPGTALSYTIYTGRIIGSLSPTNPLNSVITDLNLAPQSGGSVTYTAVFSILTPTNPAQRSGLLIHEVPNRGGNAVNTNALIQGATYVQSGWQGDLLSQCSTAPVPSYPCVSLDSGPYGSPSGSYPFFTGPTGLAAFVVQVPVATSDGNLAQRYEHHHRPSVWACVHRHQRLRPGGRKCADEHGTLANSGAGLCALSAGQYGHGAGAAMDRILANG